MNVMYIKIINLKNMYEEVYINYYVLTAFLAYIIKIYVLVDKLIIITVFTR